jgi:glycosyltransferase involved in cell wall biosynthesis
MSSAAGGDDPELHFRIESELPSEIAVGRGNLLLVHGWCFHSRLPIRRLALQIGCESQRPFVQASPRPDVAATLDPSIDPLGNSRRSGFIGLVKLGDVDEARDAELRVVVELSDGTTASRTVAPIRLLPGKSPSGARLGGDDPRVAICMATYEPPPELFRRQIDSIRAQTHANWVCLISDDGSSPESREMIKSMVGDDSRFQVDHGPRLGVYRNFERALAAVPIDAALVALADQDDRWEPEKLSVLAERLGAGAGLAYSDARITTETGEEVSPTFWTERENNHDDLGALLLVNSVTGGSAVFRSELLDYVLPFPATQMAMHDHWVALVAMSLGEVAYVDRPLYDYVQHSGAALGHESLRRPDRFRATASRPQRGRIWSALINRFDQMRRSYYIVLSVRACAELLLMRGGSAIPRRKRRVLRRSARLERSPAAWAWLVSLLLRSHSPHSKTKGVERLMLVGSLWRPMLRASTALRLPAPGPHPRTMPAMLKLPESPAIHEPERFQA